MATRSRAIARASNDAADRSRVPNLAHVLAVTALAVVVALYVRAGSAHGRVTRPPPTFATKGTEKMTTSASASLGSHPASRKLTVENLILGCSPLAGIYASSTPERATATVRTALEAGFTRFDTAPHYGLGLSEQRLGYALSRYCEDDDDGGASAASAAASTPASADTSAASAGRRRAAAAATAAELKKQKPNGISASAWWPGGRTSANAERTSPLSVASHASSVEPTAQRAATSVAS